jgi:hypothetical protein
MKKISKRVLLSITILIITYIVNLIARENSANVEKYYSRMIYPRVSLFLSKIFGLFDISMGEVIVLIVLIVFVLKVGAFLSNPSRNKLMEEASLVLLTLSVVYMLFWSLWGINNYRMPLESNFDYEIEEISIEELEETAIYLLNRIDEVEKHLEFDNNNLPIYVGDLDSIRKNSRIYFNEMAIGSGYLAEGFYSKPKAMYFSKIMSQLNYTGIYNPFTSESNLNIDIPEYKIPFVASHEIAHQRGYAGEKEANCLAFISCVESGDYYFEYSGYMSGLIYITNAIYKEDSGRYSEIRELYSDRLVATMKDNYEYWENYKGVASEIGEKNNDRFLKSTGQMEGTRSYGLVVDYLVAYVKNVDKIKDENMESYGSNYESTDTYEY